MTIARAVFMSEIVASWETKGAFDRRHSGIRINVIISIFFFGGKLRKMYL